MVDLVPTLRGYIFSLVLGAVFVNPFLRLGGYLSDFGYSPRRGF